MPLLHNLLVQIIPMFALIGLGWVMGKRLRLELKTFADLQIYAITPLVTFGAILQINFNPSYLLLPLIMMGIGGLVSSLVYRLGRRFWPGNTNVNLLALASSTANSGYFGLPVVMALFPLEWVGVYLMANMGISIAEATFGYYYLARGNFSIKESLMRVARLPIIYAVLLALGFSALGMMLPDEIMPIWNNFKGTYVVIGMMMLGIALSQQTSFRISPRFIAASYLVRHVLWAICIFAVILVDRFYLHLLPPTVHGLLALYPLLPLAVNVAAYAVDLKADVPKAAMTVMLSQLCGALLIIAFTAGGYFEWVQQL